MPILTQGLCHTVEMRIKSIENCEALRTNGGRIFLEQKCKRTKTGKEVGAGEKHAIRDLEWCWDRCSAAVRILFFSRRRF